jgi:hypothetical protein
LTRTALIPLLSCLAYLGAFGGYALSLENVVPLQDDLWVLSDAQRFSEVKRGEVAVARPGDFCDGVLLADNPTSSLDLADKNILVRLGHRGVQVWIALPPSIQTTFEATREYSYLLTEIVLEECEAGISTLGVEGIGVLGMEYLDAGNDRLELEYTPPLWQCGSFMRPRC